MGRFEMPGRTLSQVLDELKMTVSHEAKNSKGQLLGWTLERRTIKAQFRGNPLYAGTLWSVYQIIKVHADGTEEEHSAKWIHCDRLQYECKAWWYKPVGAEIDYPYAYGCPISYLDMCPVQDKNWRALVYQQHLETRNKTKQKKAARQAVST